jgi:hypothetical protein
MRSMLFLLLVLTVPVAAYADYDLGLVAFDRGDFPTAERAFSPLDRNGNPAAQYSLAILYLKTTPPQYGRAIPWLEKSAGAGLPDAQYMLGMLSLYGVGMTQNTEQGMRWLQRASDKANEEAQAMLEQLKRARLREAETQRRKTEQARDLPAELARAAATEQALRKRLAESRHAQKQLESERQSLNKARARDSQAKEAMRRTQARLEAELEAIRLQLAKAERARAAQAAVKAEAAGAEVVRAAEDASGEAVLTGKIVEILADGVLLAEVSRRVQGRSEVFPEGLVVFLGLAGAAGLSEGQAVAYAAEPATPYRYKYESGATGRIRAFRVIGE